MSPLRLRGNPWAILTALCFGVFMILLDLTIVNIAIPNMTALLDASLDEVMWVLNGYTLVLAVLIITAGRLGDLMGQRRMFLTGIALFTLASALCGLAPGVGTLIAARVLQGVGAAIAMPQSMALVVRVFPAERRGVALGVWGAVAGLATFAGPTLGGLLVTAFDWRSIFYVNIPIGLATIAMAAVLISPDPGSTRHQRLDIPGVLLATVALTLLSFGLIEGERFHWGQVYGPVSIPLLLGLSAVVFVALAVQQRARQGRDPLVPFALFADRNFGLMNLASVMMSVTMIGFPLLTVIYLQSVLGMSALQAGLAMAPMSLVQMVVAPLVGRWVDRFGGKHILVGGFLLTGGGMGWFAAVSALDSGWSTFLLPLGITGAGIGAVFGPMNSLAMYQVPARTAGAASGVLNTVRQFGSVVGGVIIGSLIQVSLSNRMGVHATAQADTLPERFREPFVSALSSGASEGTGVGGADQAPHLPPGLPSTVGAEATRLAESVFRHSFLDTLHIVGVLPPAVLAVALAGTLFVRNTPGKRRGARGGAASEDLAPEPATRR